MPLVQLSVARSRQAFTATSTKSHGYLRTYHGYKIFIHGYICSYISWYLAKKIAMETAFIIYIINKIMKLKGLCHEIFVSIFLKILSWFK
jgi:hypothetical protein